MPDTLRSLLEIPDVARHGTAPTATARRALWISLHGLFIFLVLAANLVSVPLLTNEFGQRQGYRDFFAAADSAFPQIMAVEAFVLIVLGSIRTSASVFADRTSGFLELQRLAPIDPRLFPLGKLLGVPAHFYLMVLSASPIALVCVLMGKNTTFAAAARAYATLLVLAPFYHALLIPAGTLQKKVRRNDTSGGVIGLIMLAILGRMALSKLPGCQVWHILDPLYSQVSPWGAGPDQTLHWAGWAWDPLLLATLLLVPWTALAIHVRAHQLLGHPGCPRPGGVAALDATLKILIFLGMAVSAALEPRTGWGTLKSETLPVRELFAAAGTLVLCGLAAKASPDGFHWRLFLRRVRRGHPAWQGRWSPGALPFVPLAGPCLLVFGGTFLVRQLQASTDPTLALAATVTLLEALLAVAFPCALAAAIGLAVTRLAEYGRDLVAGVFAAVNTLLPIAGLAAFGFDVPRSAILGAETLSPVGLLLLTLLPNKAAIAETDKVTYLALGVVVQALLAAGCLAGMAARRREVLAREAELDAEMAAAGAGPGGNG